MGKLGWLVALVALAMLAAAYAFSPWWSLAGLAQAVERGDRYAMQRYVDFPRVRESIASQAKLYLAEKSGKDMEEGALGALGAMIGSVIIDRAVETFVSPEGLARLMALKKAGRNHKDRRHSESRAQTARHLHRRVDLEWLDPSSVRVEFYDDEGKRITTGHLERSGLVWRLVDIEVPGLELDSASGGA